MNSFLIELRMHKRVDHTSRPLRAGRNASFCKHYNILPIPPPDTRVVPEKRSKKIMQVIVMLVKKGLPIGKRLFIDMILSPLTWNSCREDYDVG